MQWKVAILTASDKGFSGEREDTSAQVIRELVEEELHGVIVDYRIVPDEMDEIMAALIEMTDYYHADLVLTTGGIGIAARDITPEATKQVIEKEIPGLAEAIRSHPAGRASPQVMFSRGIAGIRGRSLIMNLPGSPKGVHEALDAVIEQLPVALSIIAGIEHN